MPDPRKAFGLGSVRHLLGSRVRTPGAAPDALLVKLDSGECDAILLAIELRAEQLIIDDREGRSLAT